MSLKSKMMLPCELVVMARGLGFRTVRTKWGVFETAQRSALLQLFPLYERAVKREVSKARGLFVDVGANIGTYTVMAAKAGCDVLAVEPGARAYLILNRNIDRNGVRGRVMARRVAAWSHRCLLHLDYDANDAMRKTTTEGRGEEVAGVPMDDLLKDRWPSLVLIDVEDSEAEALLGMYGTLKRCHPRVIFEARSRELLEKSLDILTPLGYSVKRLDPVNWSASPL